MNIIKMSFPESQTKNWVPLDLKKIFFLILHHVDAVKADPMDINKWHLVDNGWNGGFGYNEYIRKDGTLYIGRGLNVGAQCEGMNSKSYAIALEGNYDTETNMPKAQYDSLIQRIRDNQSHFPNKLQVVPHSQFYPTSCPGKNFPTLDILKELEPVPEHWALKHWKSLNAKGIPMLEQRFDSNITRGEVAKLLDSIAK
jgi:hypothetical protein